MLLVHLMSHKSFCRALATRGRNVVINCSLSTVRPHGSCCVLMVVKTVIELRVRLEDALGSQLITDLFGFKIVLDLAACSAVVVLISYQNILCIDVFLASAHAIASIIDLVVDVTIVHDLLVLIILKTSAILSLVLDTLLVAYVWTIS